MGDTGYYFNDLREHKKKLRQKYGVECPLCKINLPKACATILLPQQRCPVDKYKDERQYVEVRTDLGDWRNR